MSAELPPRDSFEAFLFEIRPFLPDWQAIDLRVVAIRDERGWVFDTIRATLIPDAEIPLLDNLPSTEHVLAIHQVWPSESLEKLITMLQSGKLEIDDHVIDVQENRGGDAYATPSYHLRSFGRADSAGTFGLDYTTWRLQGYSSVSQRGDWYRYREIIDGGLRSASPPWEDLSDLRRSFVDQDPDIALRTEERRIEILAPVYVRIADMALRENTAVVHVEHGRRINLGDITVAMFVDTQTGRTRDLQKLSKDITPSTEELVHEVRFTVPTSFSRLSCSLNYHAREVDRHEKLGQPLAGSHPHWLAFKEIVGDLDDLSETLAQGSGHKFERPLSLLFHLLGFSTGYYGFWNSRTGKPVPDLLAFPDTGSWFLVIEATGRDLGNMLPKLATRTKELQRAVPGYLAYSVIVTSLERELISKPDLEEAAKELTAVITANEFPQLLQLIAAGTTSEKVRSFLERLIPASSLGGPSHWPRP